MKRGMGAGKISVIIPVAPGENALMQLLDDLAGYDFDIVISSGAEGRTASLNEGAARARGEILWFLHADSRVSGENITALMEAFGGGGRERESVPASRNNFSNVIFYFDLAFSEGGMASLNAMGANLRSRIFGLPYGDQGFAMTREVFDRLGGYPAHAPYGEDLLFIRRAKKAGVALRRIASPLMTSARKYQSRGWLRLTLLRQWQLLRLLRMPV